jgi:hypothetical protein
MNENSIVYSSGINIWDESYLSTLCAFYDEVYLPATTARDELLNFSRAEDSEDYHVKGMQIKLYLNHEGEKVSAGDIIKKWENKTDILFKENVLKRLPSYGSGISEVDLLDNNLYENLSDILLDIPRSIISEGIHEGNKIRTLHLWKDHIIHLLRKDFELPSIFVANERQTNREVIKSLIAVSSFSYLLPKLSKLHPEQIMEVRNEVSSNREGFLLHLQTLSYDVETMISQDDSIEDIQRYANSVAHTKLVPDYIEFKRQLEAKKADFWGNVLDKASKVAEIDAGPSTPKFWAELLKIFGFTLLTRTASQKDQLSNRGQAFQLIRTVEKKLD